MNNWWGRRELTSEMGGTSCVMGTRTDVRPRASPTRKQKPGSGTIYRQLSEAERPGTREEAMELMLDKPSVIRRPIVEDEAGRIVAVGFKREKWERQ